MSSSLLLDMNLNSHETGDVSFNGVVQVSHISFSHDVLRHTLAYKGREQ